MKESKGAKSIKAFVIEETTLETEIVAEDYAVPLNIELVHDTTEEV